MAITLPANLEGNTDPDVVAGFNDLIAQMNAELDAVQATADGIGPEAEALQNIILHVDATIATKRNTLTTVEATAFYDALGAWVAAYADGSRLSGV